MSEQSPEEPTVALEPDTLPEHPLRVMDCEALVPKEIGLGGQPEIPLRMPDAIRGMRVRRRSKRTEQQANGR